MGPEGPAVENGRRFSDDMHPQRRRSVFTSDCGTRGSDAPRPLVSRYPDDGRPPDLSVELQRHPFSKRTTYSAGLIWKGCFGALRVDHRAVTLRVITLFPPALQTLSRHTRLVGLPRADEHYR